MKRATKRERKRRWRRKAKAWAMAKRELSRLGAALERLDGAVDRCAGELAPHDETAMKIGIKGAKGVAWLPVAMIPPTPPIGAALPRLPALSPFRILP